MLHNTETENIQLLHASTSTKQDPTTAAAALNTNSLGEYDLTLHIMTLKAWSSVSHDMLEHGSRGEPICSKTRSSHCSGPLRWISIQQGVLVIVCRLQRTIIRKIKPINKKQHSILTHSSPNLNIRHLATACASDSSYMLDYVVRYKFLYVCM